MVLAVVLIPLFVGGMHPSPAAAQPPSDTLQPEQLALVREAENERIRVIEQVIGSVVAIYGPARQGGGSGVIIEPGGLALTNHHVIEGAGLRGFGGLNDGKLYEWELVGTDPGGDVAVIQMKGREYFPFTPLGDSDQVQVGDWALAMGNPFLLAHDQVPTVTLGVVSGTERFQEGMGSQLVYGNCIQIDSSINPGNSGGPLFNMQGQVIGINGRGSFRDRGRVNVGLGYAISSNQIKHFLPDLLATKIVEHGTLDAAFSNRDGKVLCSTIDLDSPAARAGLEPGDELLEFEGRPIRYANQFKNLICTLPEDWPAHLRIRKADGRELEINVRLFGLPYNFQPPDDKPAPPEAPDPDRKDRPGDQPDRDAGDEDAGDKDVEDKDVEDKDPPAPGTPPDSGRPEPDPAPEDPGRQPRRRGQPPGADAAAELKGYLLNEPGVVLNSELNSRNLQWLFEKWRRDTVTTDWQAVRLQLSDEIFRGEQVIGQQTIYLLADGRFRIDRQLATGATEGYLYDGRRFWDLAAEPAVQLDLVEAKVRPEVVQGLALLAALQDAPLACLGQPRLDGSDKAASQVCSRILWLDAEDDWFYGWFSLYQDAGNDEVRLVKIASSRDCTENEPGLRLGDYRETAGIMLPWKKQQVRGLDEQVQWTAVTRTAEPLASVNDALWKIDGGPRQ
jgi:S1-C subfamily serine protease